MEMQLDASKPIFDLIDQRKNLLNEMKLFETTASDPRRLFKPSFRLVQEEKFRKTCFPNLMKLETSIVKKVKQFQNGITH